MRGKFLKTKELQNTHQQQMTEAPNPWWSGFDFDKLERETKEHIATSQAKLAKRAIEREGS